MISLFLIEGNLNAEIYEDMLKNQILAIRTIGEDIKNTLFRQNGAAPH
ncbi:hypothetical protein EAI_01467, partial [Harpegnathos saltator]